jgi:hypothetical protein
MDDADDELEEIAPGDSAPGVGRRNPVNIPPPANGPWPEAQSSRRGAQAPEGPTSFNGAWNATYAGPPPQGPVQRTPWYAEEERYAQPASYSPPGP